MHEMLTIVMRPKQKQKQNEKNALPGWRRSCWGVTLLGFFMMAVWHWESRWGFQEIDENRRQTSECFCCCCGVCVGRCSVRNGEKSTMMIVKRRTKRVEEKKEWVEEEKLCKQVSLSAHFG
jgi:hypothetical protein